MFCIFCVRREVRHTFSVHGCRRSPNVGMDLAAASRCRNQPRFSLRVLNASVWLSSVVQSSSR